MSKILNIILVLLLVLLLIYPNFVHAIDVNMNLTNNLSGTNTSQTNITNPSLTNTTGPYSSTSGSISTLNNLPEAELGLTNILCIILIVIGILLILLAIAILIRLKH